MADMGLARNRRRRRALWAGLAATVVGTAVAATVWTIRGHYRSAPPHDSSVVEQLGPKWNTMQQSVAALESGTGEANDLLAIASAESAMADEIRAAQASVSAPDTKAQLGDWAQGTALTAQGQRAAATASPNSGRPPVGVDNDSMRASTLTYNATAALKQACPHLQLTQNPQG